MKRDISRLWPISISGLPPRTGQPEMVDFAVSAERFYTLAVAANAADLHVALRGPGKAFSVTRL